MILPFFLSYLALVPALVFSAVPNRDLAITRVQTLGLKAFNKQEILGILKCTDDSICTQDPMMQIGTKGIGCVTSTAPGKAATLAFIYPSLEACLVQAKSTTAKIAVVVAGVLLPEVTVTYNAIMSKVTTMKKDKTKTSDQYKNQAYQIFLNKYSRSVVNNLCVKVAKALTKPQFKCLVEQGKPIFDATTYACAAFTKGNLLS